MELSGTEIRARDPRGNNFDALRLLAALSVVFSHSFLIAEGTEASEPFVWLTRNQCVLGLMGVFVFFIISGYLVTGSFGLPRRSGTERFSVQGADPEPRTDAASGGSVRRQFGRAVDQRLAVDAALRSDDVCAGADPRHRRAAAALDRNCRDCHR